MKHLLVGIRLLSLVILVVLMLGSMGCTASKPLILHPIDGSDIYNGSHEGDVCFSQFYLDNVMKVKIDR